MTSFQVLNPDTLLPWRMGLVNARYVSTLGLDER